MLLRRAPEGAGKMRSLYDAALAPTGVNVAQSSLLRSIDRTATVALDEPGRDVLRPGAPLRDEVPGKIEASLVAVALAIAVRLALVRPLETSHAQDLPRGVK
jgi:hypothetical protein